jgi:cyclopropane fatty-acyl-phospholipid synthase-like methyltransferase
VQNLLRRLSFNFWYYRQPPWDTGISPPELLEFIKSHAPGRAIDLGCGTGTNLVTLARAGWKVTGVDFAAHAITLARRKLKQAGVQAELQVSDVTVLHGIHGPFDLAFDLGCFHGISTDGRTHYIEQLDRILAPGGYWLMYGSLTSENEHASHGLTEAEIKSISSRLALRSRRDGSDTHRGWASAWFLFQQVYNSAKPG